MDQGSLEVEKLRKQLAVLARFGGHALRTDELDTLLQEATALVSEAIEVDLVKVLELLPDGETMLLRAGVNWNPGVVGRATMGAHERSPGGYALQTDQAVVSWDVAVESRFEIPALLIDHGVKSMVNVVIRGERSAFGVLEVDSRHLRKFDEDDINFLQNYANFLASAIDRIESHRELAKKAKTKELLLEELQHRVRNLLANIKALVQRTYSTSTGLDDFIAAFNGRLNALGRSQDLLTGNSDTTDIRDILLQEMEAHGAQRSEQFSIHGPELPVPSQAVLYMALAFHELMTNAIKHGALGKIGGKILVSWAFDRCEETCQVRVSWRERGVEIKNKPSRKGFGSEVLQRSLPQMLHGTSDMKFHTDGIEYVIEFPAPENIADPEQFTKDI